MQHQNNLPIEKRLRQLLLTTPPEKLELYYRYPEKYLPEYVEYLGVQRVKKAIEEYMNEIGYSTKKIITEYKKQSTQKIKLPKLSGEEKSILYASSMALKRGAPGYLYVLRLCELLGVYHPHAEQYLDINSLKYELRASAIYLYKTNPTRYYYIKRRFLDKLPRDLFDFIFPY